MGLTFFVLTVLDIGGGKLFKLVNISKHLFAIPGQALSGGKLDQSASGIGLHKKWYGKPLNTVVLECVVYQNNHMDFPHLSE